MKKYRYQISELYSLKGKINIKKNNLSGRLGDIAGGSGRLSWVGPMASKMDQALSGGSYQHMISSINSAINILNTIEEED